MDYKLQLRYGSKTLNLNNSDYFAGPDFAPPGLTETPIMATGDGTNPAGGELVDTYVADREWSFNLAVKGTTEADCRVKARAAINFLQQAKDLRDKLYLDYTPNSNLSYPPIFGQSGARISWQVKKGTANLWESYMAGGIREKLLILPVDLTVGPYAEGLPQLVGSGIGGLVEDTIGAADGRSRGLIIPEATTNEFTNPVFGHSTWNNDWTGGAGSIVAQNLDPEYILFGSCSLKITRIAANSTYYQTLNVGLGTHTLSFFAKRPGSAVVDDTVVRVNYKGSAQATSYEYYGNGWYRCWATFAGEAAGNAAGASLMTLGMTVYLTGFQVEAKANPTAFGYGDLLGWAWDGTAHASTSTRTAARLKWAISAETFDIAAGTIATTVRFDVPSTYAADMMLFDTRDAGHANSLMCWYDAGDDAFELWDGTKLITTGALSFTAGAIYVVHATWRGAILALYVNGVFITSDSYLPPTTGADFFCGTQYDTTLHVVGAILGQTRYNYAMSSTEVAADYANISPLATAGKRVDYLPWLWTKDGDNVVDNHDDSAHDNYCVIGSIPGNVEALTQWHITPSEVNKTGYWLMKTTVENFIYPTGQWYGDLSGTADVGNASGDACYTFATGGSGAQPSAGSLSVARPQDDQGPLNFFARLAHSTGIGTFKLQPWIQYSSGNRIWGDQISVTLGAYSWYWIGSMYAKQPTTIDKYNQRLTVGFEIIFNGANGNAKVDYVMIVNGPVMRLLSDLSSSWVKLIIQGDEAWETDASGLPYQPVYFLGSPVDLTPDRYNIVWFVLGDHNEGHTLASTGTFSRVQVTPRWSLL